MAEVLKDLEKYVEQHPIDAVKTPLQASEYVSSLLGYLDGKGYPKEDITHVMELKVKELVAEFTKEILRSELSGNTSKAKKIVDLGNGELAISESSSDYDSYKSAEQAIFHIICMMNNGRARGFKIVVILPDRSEALWSKIERQKNRGGPHGQ